MLHKYNFTPIASNGLGIKYSSTETVGDIFPINHEGFGQAKLKLYANLYNGNLVLQDRTLKIQETIGDLNLGFTYNSQAINSANLWHFAIKQLVQLPNKHGAVLQEEDGHYTPYLYSQDEDAYFGPYTASGRPWMRLDEKLSEWVMHYPVSNMTEYYNINGFILKRVDSAGHILTYEYDNNNKLKAIVAENERRYEFNWDDAQKTLVIYMVKPPSEENEVLLSYQFDELGRIVKTLSGDGLYSIQYSYGISNDSWKLLEVNQTDQTNLKFGYESDSKNINIIKMGDANTVKISYPRSSGKPYVNIEDGARINTQVTLDNAGNITSVSRFQGYKVADKAVDKTSYAYDQNNQLKQIIDPDNGITQFEYDNDFGMLTKKILPNQQTSYVYYQRNGERIFRIGESIVENQTQLVTRAVYDTGYNGKYCFTRFKLDANGWVTEYRPDNKGNIASVRQYTENLYDVSQMRPEVSPAYRTMQDWVAKQNPQKITLTEFQYNPRGQILVTRKYTQVDAQGNGINNNEMGEVYTYYNMFGNCFSKQVKHSETEQEVTSQKFDGLQRLLFISDPLKQLTQYEYKDSEQKMIVSYPDGKALTKYWDKKGVVVQEQESVQVSENNTQTRTTQYGLDTGGRLILTTRPDQQFVYQYYDRQNRLGFTVSATGVITEYCYDRINRYETKILYDKKIDPKNLWVNYPPPPGIVPSVDTLLRLMPGIANPDKDAVSYVFYDLSGRKNYSVDQDNFVTQYYYNNQNLMTASIKFFDRITEQELNALKQGKELARKPDFTKDSCTRVFYHNNKLKWAEQNPAGYITENSYDCAGRPIEIIQYDAKAQFDLSVNNFNQIRPLPSSKDIKQKYFYLAGFNPKSEVDPENFHTDYTYTPFGKVLTKQREGQLSQYQYDLLQRISIADKPYNSQERFYYDIDNNTVFHQYADKNKPENSDGDSLRRTEKKYNSWNLLSHEANVYTGQLLAKIDLDPNIPPPDKEKQKLLVWQNQSIRYEYDYVTELKIKITDSRNNSKVYYYDQDYRLIAVINLSNGAIKEFTRNSAGKVLVYSEYNNTVPESQRKSLTGGVLTDTIRSLLDHLKDANKDHVIYYTRNKLQLITQKIDPEKYVSTYQHNLHRKIAQEQQCVDSHTQSLTISREYDPRGLETRTVKQTASQVITVSRAYESVLGKQTAYTDEQGRVTKSQYNKLGQITVIINPDNIIIKQQTWNAFEQILTQTDSLGNQTSYQYNQQSRSVLIIDPLKNTQKNVINIFQEITLITDSLNNSQGIAHSPDSQKSVITDTLGNKTTKIFDLNGNIVLYTDANNIKTAYQYDAENKVILEIKDSENLKYQTQTIRDSFSNPIEVIDSRNVRTQQEFNNNNLLVEQVIDPSTEQYQGLDLLISHDYNAQKTLISASQGSVNKPRQYQEKTLTDFLGRNTGKEIDPDTLKLVTVQRLNLSGKVIAEVDANNNTTRKFYDNVDNLRITVDPEGGVTEWRYNSEKLNTVKIYYEQGIDPLKLNDNSRLEDVLKLVKSDSQDTAAYYYYDQNKNLRFEINSLGAVGEKQYDALNREIKTIKYMTSVDNKLIPSLTTSRLIDLMKSKASDQDRVTLKILDKKSQERFILTLVEDNKAYITEKRYDNNGNCITEAKYAIKINNPDELAKLPPEKVFEQLLLDPVNDRIIYHFFDAFNQPLYTVNSEQVVTQFWHDENENLIKTCVYRDKIIIPQNYAELADLVKTLQPNPSKDKITQHQFDKANRKKAEIDALSNTDYYDRTDLGDIKTHTDRENQKWGYQYDTARRLVTEVLPTLSITKIKETVENGSVRLFASEVKLAIQNKKNYDNTGNELQIIRAQNSDNPRQLLCEYSKRNQLVKTSLLQVEISDLTQSASFKTRPVKSADIVTKIVYNAKKLKVCEQNANGQWFFSVYNSEGKIVFEVNAKGYIKESERNIFGEVISETLYAQPVNLDLNLYKNTGIPLGEILKPGVLTKSPEDRIKTYLPDRRGNIVLTRSGKTLYYLPNGTDNPRVGLAYSEVQQRYNAFNESTCRLTLTDPDGPFYGQELSWFDRNGKVLAECDAVFRVTRHRYNSFGNEIEYVEWSQAPKQEPNPNTTLSELDSFYIPSLKDKHLVYQYNLLDSCISKTVKQVVVQEITYNKINEPMMQDAAPQDLTQYYQYNKLQKQIVITYEDGNSVYKYYDARGLEIAGVDVARQNLDKKTFYPLTYYGNDEFGKNVMTTRFYLGGSAPKVGEFPRPIGLDKNDQQELQLFDNRGLVKYKQNAEQVVSGFTYTATRKVSRQYYYLTNSDGRHLDEKQFVYDELDRTVLLKRCRNSKTVQATASNYDAFNCIAEGPGDDTWPLYRKYDVLNNVWMTNAPKGACKITLRNLRCDETVSIVSATTDLSLYTYDKLPELLSSTTLNLERTEIQRDKAGRKTVVTNPKYSDDDPNDPSNVPINIISGDGYPKFGKTTLTWVQPNESNYVLKMVIWPKASPDKKQTLEVKIIDGRCGVDVSSLSTDVYGYELDYYFTNPITHQLDDAPRYRTQGGVQIDTGNNTNSLMLVVEVAEDEFTLNLLGNTEGITAVDLYQGKDKKGEAPVDRQSGKCMADLSQFNSGVYYVVPIIPGKENLPASASFTIFTPKPSTSPLSKQFEVSVQFLYLLNQHAHWPDEQCMGQVIWNVPKKYQQYPVKFTCSFIDAHNDEITLTDTIHPGQYFGHIQRDKAGNVIHMNTFMFQLGGNSGYFVQKVLWISLVLKINDTTQLVLVDHVAPSKVEGDGDELIEVNSFPVTSLLYISPLTGFTKLPTLSYLDVTMDRFAIWKEIPAVDMDSQGIFLNVSNLQPAIYPFKIKNTLSFFKTEYKNVARPILKGQLNNRSEINKKTEISFVEEIPNYQADLSFSLLKTDRKTACELLEQEKDNQEVREKIALDIYQALVLKTLTPADDYWELLKEKYDKALKNYQAFNAVLERTRISQSSPLSVVDQQALTREKDKVEAVQKQILSYCAELKNYLHYITHLKTAGKCGVQAALVVAKKRKFNLYLWKKDPKVSNQLLLWNYHHPDSTSEENKEEKETFHFDVSGNGLFTVLIPEGKKLEEIYGQEEDNTFTVYPSDGTPYPSYPISPSQPVEIHPSSYYEYDRWNNITQYTDTLGNVTRYESGFDNQIRVLTQPKVYIIDANKNIVFDNPIIKTGYNKRGYKIGVTDANNNTRAFVLDNVGQEVSQVLEDGLVIRQQDFDVLGRRESSIDARGKVFTYQYNRLNAITSMTYPSKLTKQFAYNELNHRQKDTDQSGYSTSYDYDAVENISVRKSPTGLVTAMEFDRNRQMTSLVNPDNSALLWTRNYFGTMLSHKDAGKVVYLFWYDLKMQMLRKVSDPDASNPRESYQSQIVHFQNGNFWNFGAGVEINVTAVSKTDLVFSYNTGRLAVVTDAACGTQEFYSYDSENREIGIATQGRIIRSSIDALGEIEYTYDSGATVSMVGDANRNRCHVVINCVQNRDVWYEYDKSNRMTWDGNKNLTQTYTDGFLVQQSNSSGVYSTYQYNDDGVVTDIKYNQLISGTEIETHRDYLPNGTLSYYSESANNNLYLKRSITTDQEGWVHVDSQTDQSNNPLSVTTYGDFNEMGLPSTQYSTYTDGFVDNMTNLYQTSYEDTKLTFIWGQRKDKYGWGNASTAQRWYDPNGNANVEKGLTDTAYPDENPVVSKRFQTTYDGRILWRDTVIASYLQTPIHNFKILIAALSTSNYYYNTRGELVASYGSDPSNQATDDIILNYMQNLVRRIPDFKTNSKFFNNLLQDMFQKEKDKINNQIKAFQQKAQAPHLTLPDEEVTYPATTPREYVVSSTDTGFNAIALKLVGDENFGSAIAAANGMLLDESLFVGQKLTIPSFMQYGNSFRNTQPYEQFVSIMIGSLYPRMNLKQPKQKKAGGGFFAELFEVIVDVVAVAMGVATGNPMVAFGIAALGNAEIQEVTTGHIDFTQVLVAGVEAAISVGVMSGVNLVGTAASVAAKIGEAVVKAGAVAVADQLVEMEAGLREKFDLGSVITQMAVAAVMIKVTPLEKNLFSTVTKRWVQDLVNNVTQSILGSSLAAIIDGQKINMVSLTAQALGTTMGDELVEGINDKLQSSDKQASDAYEETKRNSVNNSGKNNAPSLGTNPNSLFAGSGKSVNQSQKTQNTQNTKTNKTNWLTANPDDLLGDSDDGLEFLNDATKTNKEFNIFKEARSQAGLSVIDKAAERARELYPEFKEAYEESFSRATEAYRKLHELEKIDRPNIEQMIDYMKTNKIAITNVNLYPKYSLFATSTKALGLGGALATGLEVGFAAKAVYEADPSQKLHVGVERFGEVGFGVVGRGFGSAAANAALLAVGAGMEFIPGPGTILGTVIIGGTVGGFAGMHYFNKYESEIESFVENEYQSMYKNQG